MEEQKLLIANQNQRIEAQSEEIKALCQKNKEQAQKIDEQAQKIDQLTYEVSVLKRHRFGKKSEKLEEDSTTSDNSNEDTEPLNSPDAHCAEKLKDVSQNRYGRSAETF